MLWIFGLPNWFQFVLVMILLVGGLYWGNSCFGNRFVDSSQNLSTIITKL